MAESAGGPSIHHVALRVTDLERSEAFYRAVFGLPLVERRHDTSGDLRAVWLGAGSSVVMLERNLVVDDIQGTGHVMVFEVADLSAFERHLETLGHSVVARTASSVYVRDPDGHTLGASRYRFGVTGR
ncbi:MAG: hypothetical protein D6705_03715 [Deltaproteobacteria bacterium]|nr:MAG: hypothetical protein D6705_03715 [Deltaproteobacteria bacterium]